MSAVVDSLRPATTGAVFTARPAVLRTVSRNSSNLRMSVDGERASLPPGSMSANPELSYIEVEAILTDKVQRKHVDLIRAFRTYDAEQTGLVTKGEFRRVLEAYCFPLTTDQFKSVINKVSVTSNGAVNYHDFLSKFAGSEYRKNNAQRISPIGNSGNNHQIFDKSDTPPKMNTDQIEKQLRDKMRKHPQAVVKAMQLYDYNRDGHIQRHELRKVLENNAFKLSDAQFDKLYHRYDFQHKGYVNYKEFLLKLGVNMDNRVKGNAADELKAQPISWRDFQELRATERAQRLQLHRPDASELAGLNFDQIEIKFRQKMKENYVNLKRMFVAMDRHLDGFVGLEDLRSLLNQFTIPMSEQLFHRLMDRVGIKATGRVSWEFFLEKFQDSKAHCNGQTLPIKPSHKYICTLGHFWYLIRRFFPIRGIDETTTVTELVRLLDEHVHSAYSTFKEAFLQMDKNRNGKITRKELRKVINKFKVTITEAQFKQLFDILDPQHTNSISYHRFLSLFETGETKEGHKWLKSVHRFNEKQAPAVLAWETVEQLLRDKVATNWKQVAGDIMKYDALASGFIAHKTLRRIFENFAMPMSDAHWENLLERTGGLEGKNVPYVTMLTKVLGVVVRPGDLDGISTNIYNQNVKSLQERGEDHQQRLAGQDESAADRTAGMSSEEIIVRLMDRVTQYNKSIRDSFKVADLRNKGKVSRKDFKRLLLSFGMSLSDEQFADVCQKLSFTNGHMRYEDFVANFEDSRESGVREALERTTNHKVNAIRGDEYGMSAEEVIDKLLGKLRQNFDGLRSAFYKFDERHTGQLTRAAFRRMLDAFMCPMSDAEWQRFCDLMKLHKGTRISYLDFLDMFETRDSISEGHKWLVSNHRYNEGNQVRPFSADKVHSLVREKVRLKYKDISEVFRDFDHQGTGFIKKNELKRMLDKFVIPITAEEFEKLWTRYDVYNEGRITHEVFLQQLAGEIFAPGDNEGTSRDIVDGSQQWLDAHHNRLNERHEANTYNQAVTSQFTSPQQLLVELKDKIRDVYKEPRAAFVKYDTRKRGYLTSADLQKVLMDLNFFLDDDQYYDFMELIGLGAGKPRLTYEGFLRIFQEGRKDEYGPTPEDHEPWLVYDYLSPPDAAAKMRAMMETQLDNLGSAFQTFDDAYTGKMRLTDLRSILDNFCFKMTDAQFRYFQKLLTVSGSDVDYVDLLSSFQPPSSSDPEVWKTAVRSGLNDAGAAMTSADMKTFLKEQVAKRQPELMAAFGERDYARIGVVNKEDFRSILQQQTMRLSDDQFEELWKTLPVNEFGNIDYKQFVLHCSGDAKRPMTSSRPVTSSSTRSLTSRGGSRGQQRPFTPMVDAERAESVASGSVSRHWKELQRRCRRSDPNNTGRIGRADAGEILDKLSLNDGELDTLLQKYDLDNDGSFAYPEFLKHQLLCDRATPRSGAPRGSRAGRLARDRISPHKLQATMPDVVRRALERLRESVGDAWQEMRRQLRAADESAQGTVSLNTFRQVLRNLGANLDEEQFYHLAAHFDHEHSGHVRYNDFLRQLLGQ